MLETVVDVPDKVVVESNVKLPPAGAAHLRPVVSALSATKPAIP